LARLIAIAANIRVRVTNTLAYLGMELSTTVKSFITRGPGYTGLFSLI